MFPPFKKLHFERNWFANLFHPMTREVLDAGGQPVFFFRMTWGSAIQIYKGASNGELVLEAKWNRAKGLQAWDVYVGTKLMGTLKSELLKTALSFGTEKWSLLDEKNHAFLSLEAPADAAMRHVLDNFTNLYNPTHVYTVKRTSGGVVATMGLKHGFFRSVYDFSLEGGTEQEKALSLCMFAMLTLMLKK